MDRIYVVIGFPEKGDPELLYLTNEEDFLQGADAGKARKAADDALAGEGFIRAEIFRNASRRLRNTDNESGRLSLQIRSDAIHTEAHKQLKAAVAKYKAEHGGKAPEIGFERIEMNRIMADLEVNTPLPDAPQRPLPAPGFLEQQEARRKEVMSRGGPGTSPPELVAKIEAERAAAFAAEKAEADRLAAEKLASGDKPKTGASKIAAESK